MMIYRSGLIPCLLICILIACKNKAPDANKIVAKSAGKKDSTILINKLAPNARFSIYEVSKFEQNIFPVVFDGNRPLQHKFFAAEPVFLLLKDLATVYMINPGEHVEIRSGPSMKVKLTIEKNVLRTNELSFFYDLNQRYPPPVSLKINSLKTFKRADSVYNEWYSNAISFLNTYSKTHHISPQYIKTASKYLYYKRLADLLGLVCNRPDAINYIKGTSLSKFPICDSCITMPHYRFAFYNYNKILVGKTTPSSSFAAEFDTAKVNFTGATKKQLLYTILNIYTRQKINSPDFSQRINYFLTTYPQDTLSKLLEFAYNFKSPSLSGNTVFDEKVYTADGKLIKWEDILSNNKGKVIVIDFWARYCGPCLYQIPFSQRLEKEFGNKKIAFIYISFDASKTNWVAGMDELKFQNRQNSYLRVTPLGSALTTYYNTNYIPKYALYNKKGGLVTINAPRPNDPALRSLLNKLVAE